MSLVSDLQFKLAAPVHLDIQGDEIVRIKTDGSEESITAYWNENAVGNEHSTTGGILGRDIAQGERGIRSGILQVLNTQEILRGDQFQIAGEIWQISPADWLGAVSGAFRSIVLRRDEKNFTRGQSQHVL